MSNFFQDVMAQVVATVVIAIFGFILTLFVKRFSQSKNWFVNKWMIIAGILFLGAALFQIYSFTKSVAAPLIALTFASALWLFIMHFYIESIKFNEKSRKSYENQFNESIASIKSSLKSDLAEIKYKFMLADLRNWKDKKVTVNVLRTYIRILELIPNISINDFEYEESLDGLQETIGEMRDNKIKIETLELAQLHAILEVIPKKYSAIVQRILASI